MKKLISLLFVGSLFGASLQAQVTNEQKFLLMSGYGLANGEFVNSVSNVNSFVYKFHPRWGAGMDLGLNFGDGTSSTGPTSSNTVHSKLQTVAATLTPNLYFFLVDSDKHLLYANVGMGYAYKNETTLTHEINADQEASTPWSLEHSHLFAFNASAGYSYKLTKNLGIGARVYFSQMEEWQVAGLLNLTVTF